MLDVTVRGAGVFGLAIALTCLERGAKVRVIDPGGPGAGASGGLVGALAPHTPDNWNTKKAFQFACLRDAPRHWARVSALSGQDAGYDQAGRLQPLPTERVVALAERRAADAARHWGSDFSWCVTSAPGASPWAPPSPTGSYLFDSISARIQPRRACAALASAIVALGGSIEREGEDHGCVIHATGWQGLLALSKDLGRPFGSGVKGQAVLLRAAAPPGTPQIYADGIHIVPHGNGTVAVGSTSERDFEEGQTTDAAAEELAARARALLPALEGARVQERWAGVRPRAATRAPVIGSWPGREGHLVANGGFKIGFGVAWGVAKLASDLALDGIDRVPDEFRIAR